MSQSGKSSMTDAVLELRTVVSNFERPMMDDIDGYVSHLEGLIGHLTNGANSIGASRLYMIKQAILAAYKIGFMHAMRE